MAWRLATRVVLALANVIWLRFGSGLGSARQARILNPSGSAWLKGSLHARSVPRTRGGRLPSGRAQRVLSFSICLSCQTRFFRWMPAIICNYFGQSSTVLGHALEQQTLLLTNSPLHGHSQDNTEKEGVWEDTQMLSRLEGTVPQG